MPLEADLSYSATPSFPPLRGAVGTSSAPGRNLLDSPCKVPTASDLELEGSLCAGRASPALSGLFLGKGNGLGKPMCAESHEIRMGEALWRLYAGRGLSVGQCGGEWKTLSEKQSFYPK